MSSADAGTKTVPLPKTLTGACYRCPAKKKIDDGSKPARSIRCG